MIILYLFLIINGVVSLSDRNSSLTFVIDVTSSMEPVIRQVEEYSRELFESIVQSEGAYIDNFVLVAFADPVDIPHENENNVTISRDRDDFKNALHLNTVRGGECPECSMSGIMSGIENSLPGSTLYVFTDAAARDFELYERVKDEALKKEIRIVFLLTGKCQRAKKELSVVYPNLAADTSGIVFNLKKDNVTKVLEWINYSETSRRIILKAKSFTPGDALVLNYTVDHSTTNTSISLSGCDSTLNVMGPDGERLRLEDLVHLDTIKVVKVLDETRPGTHTVAYDCNNNSRLVVTAKSDIQFQHGFSSFEPSYINDTTARPSPNGNTFLSIKISGNFRPKSIKFVDADDNILKDYFLPLKSLNEDEKLYVTDAFKTPLDMYRIIVTGLDLDNNATISRIGNTFVAPQNPVLNTVLTNKKPTITIEGAPKITKVVGSELRLKCTVVAYPKPIITWESKGTILKTNISESNDYDLPYTYVSVRKLENLNESNTYVCRAKNSEGETTESVMVEVRPKDFFNILEKPENVTVKYGGLVTLKCKVNAYPQASITWYKNIVTLSKGDGISDDGTELTIKDLKLDNEGSYSCTIKNTNKEENIPFQIKIDAEAPKIRNVSKSLTFKESSTMSVPCIIEKGDPQPTIHWYYYGITGTYEEIVKAKDDELLIIPKIDRKHTGKYKCEAKNDLGNDTMEATVVIEYAPIVDNDTKPVSVKAGDDVDLTCSADGVPGPDISWTKNGKPLEKKFTSSSDHRLIFTAALGDTGEYKCTAINKLGSSNKSIKVEVNTSPIVIINDKLIAVNINGPLNLTCEVLGYPKPNIRWIDLNSKKEMKSVVNEKTPHHFISRLNLMNISSNTLLQCKANNSFGDDQAEIKIEIKPYLKNLKCPKDETYVYNEAVTLKCDDVDAYPTAQVHWYREGKGSKKVALPVTVDGHMTIDHMQPTDQGTYTCHVSNSAASLECQFDIRISGLVKPEVNKTPSTVEVIENTNGKIYCGLVKGTPKPTFQWYYTDAMSKTATLIPSETSEELEIIKANRRQSGAYTCIANNIVGNDTKETTLIVQYAPIVDNDTKPVSVKAGDDVDLTCSADGVPGPDISWTKNGKPLEKKFTSSSDHRLIFTAALSDTGEFKCTAINKLGFSNKSIKVEVNTSPIVIINNKLIAVNINEPLNLTCEVLGYPKPNITWFDLNSKIEMKSVVNEKTPHHFISRLNLMNISSNTLLQCKANNSFGDDQAEIKIEIKPYLKNLKCPEDETYVYNEAVTLKCDDVDAYPTAQVHWYREGKGSKKVALPVTVDGHMTIDHMQPTDQGTYTCHVSNSAASLECQFDIRISGLVKPEINKSPSTIEVIENTNGKIDCGLVKGTPKPTFQWYYTDAMSKTATLIPSETSEELEIIKANRSQSGAYTCIANNIVGTDTKETTLIVQYAPVIGKDFKHLTVKANDDVILTCSTEGVPEPSVKWTKDNKLLDPKFTTTSDHRLKFKPGLADAGEYKCTATNKLGTSYKTTKLEVYKVPTVNIVEGDSILAEYNERLTLTCEVDGFPKPNIVWKENRIILTSAGITATGLGRFVSHFTIDKSTSNTTIYCTANNYYGGDEKYIKVTTKRAPYFKILKKPEYTVIPYTDTGYLYCDIDAFPPVTIAWYKGSHFLKTASSSASSLKIEDMQPSQDGKYTCVVNGTMFYSANVVISGIEKPEITKTVTEGKTQLRKITVSNRISTLKCNIEKGIPKPTIKWLFKNKKTNKYEEIPGTTNQTEYTVDLISNITHYACVASNVKGHDTLKIDLKIDPIKIKDGPKIKTLAQNKNLALKCKVENTISELPAPTIRWVYQGPTETDSKKQLRSNKELYKRNRITYDDRGNYTCIATDYFGREASFNYTVFVKKDAKILNKGQVFRAVSGDLAISVRCIAEGYPKPRFSFTYAGLIYKGSDVFSVNVTSKKMDILCEASSGSTFDNGKIHVVVDDYPSLDNPNITITSNISSHVALECPIPHDKHDYVRWYHNNELINSGIRVIKGDGKLHLYKVSPSDTGVYVCRVSNYQNSSSANVILEAKSKSKLAFMNDDVKTNFSVGFAEDITLDCTAIGTPRPWVFWTFNGKAITETSLNYRFKMNNTKIGKYECKVTNNIDTIKRRFSVDLSDCVLKINPDDKSAPLIMTQQFKLPAYKYDNGNIYMPQNQSIILACDDKTILKTAYNHESAYCHEKSLVMDGKSYRYSDFYCSGNQEPKVRWTKKSCYDPDSEMVEIIYGLQSKHIVIYESCMNVLSEIPFYTKQTMRLPIADVAPITGEWFEDNLVKDYRRLFDVNNQKSHISSILGKPFHKGESCVFSERQLVSPFDVFPGLPEGATYTHLNVVPHWGTCNYQNWNDVEERIRDLLKSAKELNVWTGTSGTLQLEDSTRARTDIYLAAGSYSPQHPISAYLWKVVQDPAKKASIAIIQLNVPDVRTDEAERMIKCHDVCRYTKWMKADHWQNTRKGFIFCCKLDDFENEFGYSDLNIFGRNMYDLLV